jgi:succinoglycan biosynthesis protein ExoO
MVTRIRPDVVWVDHTFLAPLVSKIPRGAAVRIVDTHDVMHLRDESLRAAGLAPDAGVTRAQEQELLRAFDLVVAIQDQERQELEAMLPGRRVITVEHAVPATPARCDRPSLCFVGSAYEGNVHSALSFIAASWPAIRARCPAATLEIVGGVCGAEGVRAAAAADERIVLRGVVPNIADIYAGPAAVVCPLWMGSGLKIKLVEALAHGKATIASPIAAQGLEDGRDVGFLHAATLADFVEPAVRLLSDTDYRARWEQAAVHYAARFEPEVVFQDLDGLLFGRVAAPAPRRADRSARAAA